MIGHWDRDLNAIADVAESAVNNDDLECYDLQVHTLVRGERGLCVRGCFDSRGVHKCDEQ